MIGRWQAPQASSATRRSRRIDEADEFGGFAVEQRVAALRIRARIVPLLGIARQHVRRFHAAACTRRTIGATRLYRRPNRFHRRREHRRVAAVAIGAAEHRRLRSRASSCDRICVWHETQPADFLSASSQLWKAGAAGAATYSRSTGSSSSLAQTNAQQNSSAVIQSRCGIYRPISRVSYPHVLNRSA